MNKIVGIVIIVIAFIASAFLSYKYFAANTVVMTSNYHPPSADNGDTSEVASNEPKTEECPLNGEMLTASQKKLWQTRRPLGVMIENHEDARPQSGLSSADVVYEALAEGGITRFLAMFYCKDSVKYVGPVRSARVYYIDLVSEYGDHPLYTHVGGANCNKTTGSGCANGAKADALGRLDKMGWAGYNDLNFVPFPVMWRDYERLPGVATEHTVYSTTKKLWDYAASNRKLTNVDEDGKAWDANFVKWKFKDDAPAANPLPKIDVQFSNNDIYNVEWQYDKAHNAYLRFNGGKPHLDKNTNKQIEAKNVIVAFAKEYDADDGYDAGDRQLVEVTGTNDAIFFMDGKATKGTWVKKDANSRMKFYDANGKEIQLNRGQDFIEVVPEGHKITY